MCDCNPSASLDGWNEVRPGIWQPNDLAKREQVRRQTEQACKSDIRITCGCGKQPVIHRMYRCLYCGEWYCATCAEAHFGRTRDEYAAGNKEGIEPTCVARGDVF